MAYDPPLFDRKAAFMQRISDYVRLGYCYWTTGEVSAERALSMVRKFDKLYAVGRTRHQRAYARTKGEASAVLLLYAPSSGTRGQTKDLKRLPADSGGQTTGRGAPMADSLAPTTDKLKQTTDAVRWTLLITPGEHVAHRLESLRDARTGTGRICLTGSELVRLPRVGQAKPSWTWRMTAPTYEGWRARLLQAARRSADALMAEMAGLGRIVGFAGCRVQGKKLQALGKSELRRRHPSDAVTIPRLRYVQRLPNGELSLSSWLKTRNSTRS